jgi:hypothetical protein
MFDFGFCISIKRVIQWSTHFNYFIHQYIKCNISKQIYFFHHFRQCNVPRRVWRYQRGNQNLYIEEEQTTQWPKEKVQKNKQRPTKHTYKTKDRATRTPLKTGGELRCSGRVRSSCSINLLHNIIKSYHRHNFLFSFPDTYSRVDKYCLQSYHLQPGFQVTLYSFVPHLDIVLWTLPTHLNWIPLYQTTVKFNKIYLGC